jgi:hypothetical protein
MDASCSHTNLLRKVHDLEAFCAQNSNLGFQENEIEGFRRQKEFLTNAILASDHNM